MDDRRGILNALIAMGEQRPVNGLLGQDPLRAVTANQNMLAQALRSRTKPEFQMQPNTPQGLLDGAALATSPVPILGDLIGLGADGYRFATDPSSRTPLNFGLAGLGLLPFVPSGAGAMRKYLSKDEMIKRGADGHLSKAMEGQIPVSKIDGLEPRPTASEGMPYVKGRKITQPVEVAYNKGTDTFTLYAGNHRVTQAKINGDEYIPAFIEPDGGVAGLKWIK